MHLWRVAISPAIGLGMAWGTEWTTAPVSASDLPRVEHLVTTNGVMAQVATRIAQRRHLLDQITKQSIATAQDRARVVMAAAILRQPKVDPVPREGEKPWDFVLRTIQDYDAGTGLAGMQGFTESPDWAKAWMTLRESDHRLADEIERLQMALDDLRRTRTRAILTMEAARVTVPATVRADPIDRAQDPPTLDQVGPPVGTRP